MSPPLCTERRHGGWEDWGDSEPELSPYYVYFTNRTVNYMQKHKCLLLCLPSIYVETYCFTCHRSIRPISFVSVRSLCLLCRLLNTRR